MCGVAGCASVAGPVSSERVAAICAAQVHRGPDSRGLHVADEIGLGIQRLAVIDLERGDQPVYNEDRSVVVVLNGEIYNFRALREELRARGHRFATGSDTEVIVHLYEELGDRLVERLDGMFCFALWDADARRLLIARDRVGKKPLHYHLAPDGTLTFASELGALMRDPSISPELDRASLDQYLALGYVNAPRSIYRDVRKLEPGRRIVWQDGRIKIERWWRLDYSERPEAPTGELVERLRDEVREAVRRRLIADVPLGAFLSGGIDSAIVVAQMAELVSGPVRTFTIGFSDEGYDERRAARTIAERFGTDHTDLQVTPDAGEILPRLVHHFGEPFADSSAIPSFYLAELARSHVTVALNGDGGDESFAGYRRHLVGARTAWLDRVPSRPRRAIARVADRTLGGRDARSAREYAGRLLGGIGLDGVDRYHSYLSVFSPDERRALLAEPTPEVNESPLRAPWNSATGHGELSRILQTDVETYLPGDLLVKMDIATMAHSLEARSPLLDHHLMEFAAGLPDRLKLRGLSKKWILRQAYRGTIPDATLDAPKRGFGVPLASWFRGPLGEMARERLAGADACGGLIRPERAQRIVAEHRAGKADRSAQIWTLLVLDEWCRQGRG
ncbi:MAG: asparagine synthase (glutamine-hydrolyzing) [Solirubrobacterales bacterium]